LAEIRAEIEMKQGPHMPMTMFPLQEIQLYTSKKCHLIMPPLYGITMTPTGNLLGMGAGDGEAVGADIIHGEFARDLVDTGPVIGVGRTEDVIITNLDYIASEGGGVWCILKFPYQLLRFYNNICMMKLDSDLSYIHLPSP
jgi:hypothetical protein